MSDTPVKVLIANRGEVALRVLRACRTLGLPSVVVFSEPDRNTLAVRLADEAICIGSAPASDSYLKVDRIIAAAELTGATAIHPGYGFLSENSHFAEICRECGITFIGPSPEAIRLLGDKAAAKATMQKAGVPVIPGSSGAVNDVAEAGRAAQKVGYPVILKAASGGGGKGMRLAPDAGHLPEAFQTAAAEAKAGFGDDTLYLEKYLVNPRHVEIQLLADGKGGVLCLGERDCSLQRHHQKVVEESPCSVLPEDVRRKMMRAAVAAAQSARYAGVGTAEFLFEPSTRNFYFMEMNTRLQVEHPVTEMVWGVDLVAAQIQVALGGVLPWKQEELQPRGHAIEVRINAEDPTRDFAPVPGQVQFYHAPGGPGIRVDSHLYDGYVVPPYYDSLLAKVIAHGETREVARRRMILALEEFTVEGITTTTEFSKALLESAPFVQGDFHTGTLQEMLRE
ncbi:MAG: acetyl-CoA carboxylase biotin carboxylase subunit [Oligosphaeraceae bacterium]